MHDSATPNVKGGAIAERITVRGLVQGVGFRPTVWRLARELSLSGTVSNNGGGVEIYICGEISNIEKFVLAIRAKTPALSRIDSITRTTVPVEPGQAEFRIIHSDSSAVTTGIVPDATVCDECRAETLDTFARRFRYPFTNCTNCGPRLSIIENIPYDRANTTMRGFEMCSGCRDEYEDPADRRFHAQPVGCHKCGPRVWLERADGRPMSVDAFTTLDDVDAAITLIHRGSIIAIKGIGGFQLACDATNEAAVERLRSLKHRQRKPFALMVRDIEVARQICQIDDIEQELLLGAAAPIVILERLIGPTSKIEPADDVKSPRFQREPSELNVSIADSVAPGINSLGLMLPNTPLHHLILSRIPRPIVLTSGNISDEPQSIDNDHAAKHLSGIADYFLLNDRPIAQRVDDSVVRLMAGETRVLRRARGYAPAPFVLPSGFESAPPILAFGGELKNTFCLIRDGQAIVSQHIGDLEDAKTQADYRHNLNLYERLYQHRPAALACDLHPEYLSSKLARERSETEDIPVIETQHHHAHMASCLAENLVPIDAPPVIGVALDGLGFGDDGTFWGGEFMLADYSGYKRLAAFKPVAMIGGEMAMKEPWRNTYAHLMAAIGWQDLARNYSGLELFDFLEQKPRATLDAMIARGVNSPLTSSAGRLFDAVAAAIGICQKQAVYEGQAAIELEASIDHDTLQSNDQAAAYPFSIQRGAGSGLFYLDPLSMWWALLGDLASKTPAPIMASRFHQGLAIAIVQMIAKLNQFGIVNTPVTTIALSGGVWQNKVLLEQVVWRLEQLDLTVLTQREFPSNDGGLSLGQAAIAAAKLLSGASATAAG